MIKEQVRGTRTEPHEMQMPRDQVASCVDGRGIIWYLIGAYDIAWALWIGLRAGSRGPLLNIIPTATTPVKVPMKMLLWESVDVAKRDVAPTERLAAPDPL
jgi:hypothetical protein